MDKSLNSPEFRSRYSRWKPREKSSGHLTRCYPVLFCCTFHVLESFSDAAISGAGTEDRFEIEHMIVRPAVYSRAYEARLQLGFETFRVKADINRDYNIC